MFRRSVLSQWRIYQSGTVMRITCSAQGKQLLGFLGRDRVMLACLPIEQSCLATHCPRHTAQMSGRGLAAGGILSVTAGHPPTPCISWVKFSSPLLLNVQWASCPSHTSHTSLCIPSSFPLFFAHVLPPSILFFSVFISKTYAELLTWTYK